MPRTGFLTAVAALATVVMCSCLSRHTELMTEVNPAGWHPGKPAVITYDNDDTLSRRTIDLLVRYRGNKFGPLDLDITTLTPDTLTLTERVTIAGIAQDAGAYQECEARYRTGVVLLQKGNYSFKIAPASVRLKGVTAVGVRISRQDDGQR